MKEANLGLKRFFCKMDEKHHHSVNICKSRSLFSLGKSAVCLFNDDDLRRRDERDERVDDLERERERERERSVSFGVRE